MAISLLKDGACQLKSRHADGSGVALRLVAIPTEDTVELVGRECTLVEFEPQELALAKADVDALVPYTGPHYRCQGPVNEKKLADDRELEAKQAAEEKRPMNPVLQTRIGCNCPRTLEYLSLPYDGKSYAVPCPRCGVVSSATNSLGSEPWRARSESAEANG